MTKFSEIEMPRKIKKQFACLPEYIKLDYYEFISLSEERLVSKPIDYGDWVKSRANQKRICYLTVRGRTYAEYLQEMYRAKYVTEKRAKWSLVISFVSLIISAIVAFFTIFAK